MKNSIALFGFNASQNASVVTTAIQNATGVIIDPSKNTCGYDLSLDIDSSGYLDHEDVEMFVGFEDKGVEVDPDITPERLPDDELWIVTTISSNDQIPEGVDDLRAVEVLTTLFPLLKPTDCKWFLVSEESGHDIDK